MALLKNVILRDTRANQPLATAVAAGTLYCVTDEDNLLERSSGTAWETFGRDGGGDVTGPLVSTDHAVPRFDGTDGGTLLNSSVTIDDSNNVAGASSLAVAGTLQPQSVATFAGQYVSPLVDDGNSGLTATINWALGNEHYLTLTESATLTFSNATNGGRYVLLIDTGAGGSNVTWPSNVVWPDGVGPTITTTGSVVDLFTFCYIGPLGVYLGSFNQNYSVAGASPSLSPSKSASVSPSVSESASASVSASRSASVSGSGSESISPSVSASGTPSISPSHSDSVSPSASISQSRSASKSPSKSQSASPSVSQSLSASASA